MSGLIIDASRAFCATSSGFLLDLRSCRGATDSSRLLGGRAEPLARTKHRRFVPSRTISVSFTQRGYYLLQEHPLQFVSTADSSTLWRKKFNNVFYVCCAAFATSPASRKKKGRSFFFGVGGGEGAATCRWGGGLEAGCFLCLARLRAKEEKASFHKEKYFLHFFLFLPPWNQLEIVPVRDSPPRTLQKK